MLKQLRLLLLVLIALIWFVFILPYLLVQTELGSRYASQVISQYNDDYSITIGKVYHSITKPYEITLENIKIQDKAQTSTYLSAKKLVIGLKSNDLLQSHSFDYLLFENGEIELLPTMQMIETQFLQLKNVSVHYISPNKDTDITLKNVYGGVKPWSNQLMTNRQNAQFNCTIQAVTYNQFNIQSVYVQGTQKNQTLTLANLGGNINQGYFTANGTILPDNSIEIGQLKLNNINFQSAIDPFNIDELFASLPKTKIQLLSVINSSMSIPTLTIEKGNLEAKNIRYNDSWQLQNSDLTFNAQSIVWHEELIEQPLLQWRYDNNKIVLDQAMALWNKGNIKLSGNWQNNQLTIDTMIAGGFRYQLPANWYQSLNSQKFSDLLPAHIVIKQLMLMPTLLIDTDPQLPFQFSSFEAFGNNIEISTSKTDLSINGTILVKADNATLNTVELKKPDLSLTLTPTGYGLTFSTLIDQGILEGRAHLLTTKQLQSLTLNAHAIDSKVLSLWHLINNPVTTNKFHVELHGDLDPLSLSGQLQADDKNYLVENNQLVFY